MEEHINQRDGGMKIAILALVFMAMASVALADSYELWCLGSTDVVDLPTLCNPDMSPISGPGNICMHRLDNGKICPASPNTCNGLGLGCTSAGNTTVDQDPPTITVLAPINFTYYPSTTVQLAVNTDEFAELKYRDNERSSVWRNMCSSCTSYDRALRFYEGRNNITIKARDKSGNTAYADLLFYVDSKIPKIRDSIPDDGDYSDGSFTIEYDEENMQSITLFYKKQGDGWLSLSKSSAECPPGLKQTCSFDPPLAGEFSVEYYFTISDSATTVFSKKNQTVLVDTIAPVMDVAEPVQDGIYDSKKIYHVISISEPVDVTYIDNNDKRPKEKSLCKDTSYCDKSKSFKEGPNNITYIATDPAGNQDTSTVTFLIDTEKPRIQKTEPKRGFTNGQFSAVFDELNPTGLNLYFGVGPDFEVMSVDIGSCTIDRNKYYCDVLAGLTGYDGSVIKYWFNLSDVIGRSVASRPASLTVDTTVPGIANPAGFFAVDGRYVQFNLTITEANLDTVNYIDNGANARTLCSSLKNGRCERKVLFAYAFHHVDIEVWDKAGNVIATSAEFTI